MATVQYPVPFPTRVDLGDLIHTTNLNDLKTIYHVYFVSGGFKNFEGKPYNHISHYWNGTHKANWAGATIGTLSGADDWHSHQVHAALVDNAHKRVLQQKTASPEDIRRAKILIDNIIEHHKATVGNWLYHVEANGWDSSYYKNWLAPVPYFTEQDYVNRAAAIEQGKAHRQKYLSIAKEFSEKLIGVIREAADEARPFYEKWAQVDGLENKEENNAVKVDNVKMTMEYTRIAPWKEQSPEVKATLDGWVNKNYPGTDADGINTPSRPAIGDYYGWIQTVFIKLLNQHMAKNGAPEVVTDAYKFGVRQNNESHNLIKAVPYLGKITVPLDLLDGLKVDVIGGFNPKTDRGGPCFRVSGINTELLCAFSDRNYFYCPKVNFAKVAGDYDIDEFPNKSDWRRPAGYVPPAPKAAQVVQEPKKTFIGEVPAQAELFLDWSSDKFTTVAELEFAFKVRLNVLEGWRDTIKKRLEEEERKKGGAIEWEPFNPLPADQTETMAIYQKRLAEWQTKTGGKDMVKMQEIIGWLQSTTARLSAEAMAKLKV